MIRVVLPYHLRILARVSGEIELDVKGAVSLSAVLDALEARYPVLRGSVRDSLTQKRRAMVRFFACQQDWSHTAPDALLPEEIASGKEAFLIVAAIAGG
jgi:sulfur-carrier protein